MNDRPCKATRLTGSAEEQNYRTLNEIAVARDPSVSRVICQAIRRVIEAMPEQNNQEALIHPH
jgi:hypothetical protein